MARRRSKGGLPAAGRNLVAGLLELVARHGLKSPSDHNLVAVLRVAWGSNFLELQHIWDVLHV